MVGELLLSRSRRYVTDRLHAFYCRRTYAPAEQLAAAASARMYAVMHESM